MENVTKKLLSILKQKVSYNKISPFLGPSYSEDRIKSAIEKYSGFQHIHVNAFNQAARLISENKILGWKNRKSYNERDERRIKTELPQYIIEENEYRSIVKSIDILKTVINLPYISTETTCYSPTAPTCDDKYDFPRYGA